MLIRRCVRRDGGAAAVELALLLPLLVMLAFGIIQFGTAYNRQQGMQAAVREGGRLASTSTTADPFTADDIAVRVWNSLQGNGGGSGYPATPLEGGRDPNNPADVQAQKEDDVVVEVTNLTGPTDDTSSPIAGGADACAGAHSVKVVSYVRPDRQEAYGIILPLVSNFDLPMRVEAIFRCLGS